MAFTTRSVRQIGFGEGDVPPTVGPGSYSVPSTIKAAEKVSYVPFSTSATRRLSPEQNYAPGPGEYSVSIDQWSKGVTAGFASKAKRFSLTDTEQVPGPGMYPISNTWNQKISQTEAKKKLRSERSNTVKWVRSPTAPAIPSVHQSYGYEENTEGELIMQPNPNLKHSGKGVDTAGPGEYNVFGKALKQSGTSWSKSRSKRSSNVRKSEAPGPGQYLKHGSLVKGSAIASSAFVSSSNRWGTGSDKAPGPGTYSLPSSIRAVKKPTKTQCFGTTSARSELAYNSVAPGPGQYNQPSSIVAAPPSQGKGSSFMSTSTRFTDNKDDNVGPGTYVSHSDVSRKLGEKVFGRNASFGVTSSRFADGKKTKAKVSSTPGPGHFNPPPQIGVKDKRPTSVFLSRSKRFSGKSASKVGPGSHDTRLSWIKNSQGKGTLASGSPRFNEKYSENPGPGTYGEPKLPGSAPAVRSAFASKSGRFNNNRAAEAPGPGQYDTSTKLIKRSFNITVNDL